MRLDPRFRSVPLPVRWSACSLLIALIAAKRFPCFPCFPLLPVASRCFPCAFPLLIFANLCVWTPVPLVARFGPAVRRCVMRKSLLNAFPLLPVASRGFPASRCFPCAFPLLIFANLCVWTPVCRSAPLRWSRCRVDRVNRVKSLLNAFPCFPLLPVASRCFPLLPVRVSAANLC